MHRYFQRLCYKNKILKHTIYFYVLCVLSFSSLSNPNLYFRVNAHGHRARRGLQGQPGGAAPEPSGPGVAEVIAVDGSIVMVLKPNELAKKKRKFKQVQKRTRQTDRQTDIVCCCVWRG